MLRETGLLDASTDIFPIVANALYGIFGQIVVPRYAVMLQECEQALAISEQALTVMSGRVSIGFVVLPTFSFGFDRVRCALAWPFLARNWCEISEIAGQLQLITRAISRAHGRLSLTSLKYDRTSAARR